MQFAARILASQADTAPQRKQDGLVDRPLLFARDVLVRNPGATIIFDVKCSSALAADIRTHGGVPLMYRSGHSLIKAKMHETGALLAGDLSGHIFFNERWYGFDDAIYVTGRLLEILSRTDLPLSALLADVPVTHVTPEIRLDCPDDKKVAVVAAVTRRLREDPAVRDVVAVDGVRAMFDGGWGLVRASNTQPALVMRCEGATKERLAEIRATVERHLDAAKAAT